MPVASVCDRKCDSSCPRVLSACAAFSVAVLVAPAARCARRSAGCCCLQAGLPWWITARRHHQGLMHKQPLLSPRPRAIFLCHLLHEDTTTCLQVGSRRGEGLETAEMKPTHRFLFTPSIHH